MHTTIFNNCLQITRRKGLYKVMPGVIHESHTLPLLHLYFLQLSEAWQRSFEFSLTKKCGFSAFLHIIYIALSFEVKVLQIYKLIKFMISVVRVEAITFLITFFIIARDNDQVLINMTQIILTRPETVIVMLIHPWSIIELGNPQECN